MSLGLLFLHSMIAVFRGLITSTFILTKLYMLLEIIPIFIVEDLVNFDHVFGKWNTEKYLM